MRYGSVCSGIEAATQAWYPLGWEAAFFSEIERFPREVLKYHYSSVPLHGRDQRPKEEIADYADVAGFQTIKGDEYGSIDVLVGGTPCQSFSVAGLRGGLDDDRGNLSLEYLKLAQRTRATWLVWENVPGVLSSNGGRDFGAILGGMVELGYGFAYRVLDAQYFGVPQRRRRVFVVGYFGDWRPAAAVLFERHGLQGHPAPRRESRETASSVIARGSPGSGRSGLVEVVPPLDAQYGAKHGTTHQDINVGCPHLVLSSGQANAEIGEEYSPALNCNRDGAPIVFNWQNGGGYGKAEDGLGITEEGSGPLQTAQTPAVAFKPSHYTRGKDGAPAQTVPPLSADADKGDQDPVVLAFKSGQSAQARGLGLDNQVAPTLPAGESGTRSPTVVFDEAQITHPENRSNPQDGDPAPTLSENSRQSVAAGMQVRRLTPRECERLQGFPDDYTAIPWRGKPADQCPDGPRYKALGNSMAVPVMRWIGERINRFNQQYVRTGIYK